MIRVLICSVFVFGSIVEQYSVVFSREVHMNNNITTEAYSDGILLNCSFSLRNDDSFKAVILVADDSTNGTFGYIAGVFDDFDPIITVFGEKLFGKNETVLQFDKSQNLFTLTFNNVTCRHERQYKCILRFRPKKEFDETSIESDIMNISVTVHPSKPQMFLSKIEGELPKTDMQNNSTTDSLPDFNENAKIATLMAQNTNPEMAFSEGDNITFICNGDIGRPKGRFVWQKIHSDERQLNYSNITTESIAEACSYNGTSNLKIDVTPVDNQARIRCVVKSAVSKTNVSTDSPPLLVYFHVRMSSISVEPYQSVYKEGDSVRLNCKAFGNPKPSFSWTKDNRTNEIITYLPILVLEKAKINDSGLYVCNTHNIVDGKRYSETVSKDIEIEENQKKYDKQTGNWKLFLVLLLLIPLFVILGFALNTCYNRRKNSRERASDACTAEFGNYAYIKEENTDTDIKKDEKRTTQNRYPEITTTEFSMDHKTAEDQEKLKVIKDKMQSQTTETEYAYLKDDVYDHANDNRHIQKENTYDTVQRTDDTGTSNVHQETHTHEFSMDPETAEDPIKIKREKDKMQSQNIETEYADLAENVYDHANDNRHIQKENTYDTVQTTDNTGASNISEIQTDNNTCIGGKVKKSHSEDKRNGKENGHKSPTAETNTIVNDETEKLCLNQCAKHAKQSDGDNDTADTCRDNEKTDNPLKTEKDNSSREEAISENSLNSNDHGSDVNKAYDNSMYMQIGVAEKTSF